MAFPPIPTYPQAIDSDRTLYMVYNSTQSRLCTDNSPWSQEIEILPVSSDALEIWPDNGFATLDGELLYYDKVAKNIYGKVYKLLGCARSLGGIKTKFNPKGTWIRGNVVAEHHNQLADAVMKVENFVGYNYDPREETLDWRIRNLEALEPIFDDFGCPEIDFTFIETSNDPVTGIIANYNLVITPPGSVSSFRLDFGDGQFTTTSLSGTHQYALNSTIDPVVTVSNSQCQIIQTPIERTNPVEPPFVSIPTFEIPVPASPTIPDFTIVPCSVPEPQLNLPALLPPCGVSVSGGTSIPSVITGPTIEMVSHVLIEGPTNPVQILHSLVTITGPDIPSIIFVDIPPTIVIDPPIPPTIVIIPESSITMGFDTGELPKFEMDWGTPPPLQFNLSAVKTVKNPVPISPQAFALENEFGEEFADIFEGSSQMKVDYETIDFPTELKLVTPESIKLDFEGLSKEIKLILEEVKFPDSIKLVGPDIPNRIDIHGPTLPTTIDLVGNVPSQIEVVGDVPSQIEIIGLEALPPKIEIELVSEIPSQIMVELLNPMSVIEVIGFPEGIPLIPPESLPEVKMVYEGGPLELKLVVDEPKKGEEAKGPCFMLVNCDK